MRKKLLVRFIALTLAFIMLTGVFPAFAFDQNFMISPIQELALNHDQPHESMFVDELILSEARQKYYQLLVGSSWSVEIVYRFHDLFGYMSPEYILHNYTNIFDITSEEMDQAVLRALTRGANRYDSFERVIHSFDDGSSNWLEEWKALHSIPKFEHPNPLPSPFEGESVSDDSYLLIDEDDIELEIDTSDASEVNLYIFDSYERIMPLNATEVNISIVSVTDTSVTLDVFFNPRHWDINNYLVYIYIDAPSNDWTIHFGYGSGSIGRSGRLTIHGLSPGLTYLFQAGVWDEERNMWIEIQVAATTSMPPERLIRFERSNVIFNLDETLVNTWGGQNSVRTQSFLNVTNRAYATMHGLVGGSLPYNGTPIELRNTRVLPWTAEAIAGPPILWQTNSTTEPRLFYALNHGHAMNRFNANTTETPIHEIGHHFDNWRWSFCAEAFAHFFTYYYYDRTNERMAVAGQTQVWVGGSGFRTYIRSHANRIMGVVNFDASVAQGVYSCYGIAWTLANIQTRIGWEPFRQTFRYFHELDNSHPSQIPPSNLGKLNLFLSALSDFSGQNVFNMLSAQERTVYQAHFGGTIQRVNVPEPRREVTVGLNPNGGTVNGSSTRIAETRNINQ